MSEILFLHANQKFEIITQYTNVCTAIHKKARIKKRLNCGITLNIKSKNCDLEMEICNSLLTVGAVNI